MGWADNYIKQLKEGKSVSFRPRGNSMSGRIESGQLVTVEPLAVDTVITEGDIVLCKVGHSQYLHLVTGVTYRVANGWRYQISNNKGYVNGWIFESSVYGIVVGVSA